MTQIIALSWEYEVSAQPVLDQRSTSANKTVEEAWRNTSAHRVNWLLLYSLSTKTVINNANTAKINIYSKYSLSPSRALRKVVMEATCSSVAVLPSS